MREMNGRTALVTRGVRGIGASGDHRRARPGGPALAAELGTDAACPHLDVTDADGWAAALELAPDRFGEPAEVAAMALFVAMSATCPTGSEFVVAGGAVVGSMITA